jgi:hypothetical protein
MRHEMDLARRVQDAMLPKKMPDVPGIEAFGWTRAASVTGGDCFDLWRTNDGRLAMLLADASGHGLAPTLVVSQVRTLIRAFAEVDPHPRRLLERANARLSEDLESERFVTAFLAFLSPDGTLDWCSAGHGPILVRESPDEEIIELVPNELPLGVLGELTGEAAPTVRVGPGGCVAVVSRRQRRHLRGEAPRPRGRGRGGRRGRGRGEWGGPRGGRATGNGPGPGDSQRAPRRIARRHDRRHPRRRRPLDRRRRAGRRPDDRHRPPAVKPRPNDQDPMTKTQ